MALDYATAPFSFSFFFSGHGGGWSLSLPCFCCPQGLVSLVQLWASGVETPLEMESPRQVLTQAREKPNQRLEKQKAKA